MGGQPCSQQIGLTLWVGGGGGEFFFFPKLSTEITLPIF